MSQTQILNVLQNTQPYKQILNVSENKKYNTEAKLFAKRKRSKHKIQKKLKYQNVTTQTFGQQETA